jgi:hypothetical protein
MITLMVLVPLAVALFLESIVMKIICWGILVLIYMSCLPVQGPCVMAIAVGVLPWYVFFEWKASPPWLAIVAGCITLIEVSYIVNRMRFIREMREKEGILL